MEIAWFYERAGELYGPYSAAKLRELAAAGILLSTDLVWREGNTKTIASKVRGLFPTGGLGVEHTRLDKTGSWESAFGQPAPPKRAIQVLRPPRHQRARTPRRSALPLYLGSTAALIVLIAIAGQGLWKGHKQTESRTETPARQSGFDSDQHADPGLGDETPVSTTRRPNMGPIVIEDSSVARTQPGNENVGRSHVLGEPTATNPAVATTFDDSAEQGDTQPLAREEDGSVAQAVGTPHLVYAPSVDAPEANDLQAQEAAAEGYDSQQTNTQEVLLLIELLEADEEGDKLAALDSKQAYCLAVCGS